MGKQWAGRLIGMGMLLAGPLAMANTFQGLRVEVIGQGRQVLMVPGLNSGIESWRDTCLALQSVPVQCHLVQLPGFAGQPADSALAADFLPQVLQRLEAYVDQRMDAQPVLAGHSLGGFASLQLAARRPGHYSAVIVADSLPFFPLAGNPAATAENSKPMADAMVQQMRSLDAATYRTQAQAALAGMTKLPQRLTLLQQWSDASDRETTAQAMHALMTTDIRPQLPQITAPVLVLGAWEAYARFGGTQDITRGIFQTQYAGLPSYQLAIAPSGYHFLMWDAPDWLEGEVRQFLSAHR